MTRRLVGLCADCRQPTRYGPRCQPCTRARARLRPTPAQRGYGPEWQRLSRAVREEQPWCGKCGTMRDLSVDHVIPGSLDAGVRVLCRRCHARFGARHDREAKP